MQRGGDELTTPTTPTSNKKESMSGSAEDPRKNTARRLAEASAVADAALEQLRTPSASAISVHSSEPVTPDGREQVVPPLPTFGKEMKASNMLHEGYVSSEESFEMMESAAAASEASKQVTSQVAGSVMAGNAGSGSLPSALGNRAGVGGGGAPWETGWLQRKRGRKSN